MKHFIFITLFLSLCATNLLAGEISRNPEELQRKYERCRKPGDPLYGKPIYVLITNENLQVLTRCRLGIISAVSDGWEGPVFRFPVGYGCTFDSVKEISEEEYKKYFSDLTVAYKAQEAARLKALEAKK